MLGRLELCMFRRIHIVNAHPIFFSFVIKKCQARQEAKISNPPSVAQIISDNKKTVCKKKQD